MASRISDLCLSYVSERMMARNIRRELTKSYFRCDVTQYEICTAAQATSQATIHHRLSVAHIEMQVRPARFAMEKRMLRIKERSFWSLRVALVALLATTEGVKAFADPPALTHPTFVGKAPPATVLRESVLDRFTNPRIDDPALPLSEAGIAQVISPSLEIFFRASSSLPYPTWAAPIGLSNAVFPRRGSFLAPTLIHGAGLACCWLAGCLAAKGFERDAFEGDLGTVIFSTLKAGAFASGVLILATQIDLYREFGSYVQLGDSPSTDGRILTAAVEVASDIFFEATTFISWRILRSNVK